MLEELTIRNFALIDLVQLRFKPGFNVLTGETGAGKSILIDALSLALGSKGSADSLREGADEAEVVATLRVSDTPELNEWTEKYGIQPEDGCLIIRRTLRANGRGTASVQAVPVTRAALSELADAMVDLHGQHEHQSLFNVGSHRKFLDRFAGLEERVANFGALFSKLNSIGKELEALEQEEGQMAREAEFLRFAVDEIDAAVLKDGEEEELAERQPLLARHEELLGNLETVLESSSEGRNGALSQLRITREGLKKAARIDTSLAGLLERFDTAFLELEDIVEEVRRKRDEADYDPAELERIDERLARIGFLEKKYGAVDIAGVLNYAESARSRLEGYENRDEERHRLGEQRAVLQKQLISEASLISEIRKSAADKLRIGIEKHLHALGMREAEFRVELDRRRNDTGKASIGPYGIDDVEFLLSANHGESLKPLRSVASGGELSRVMLAIKTVLAESDSVQTMIFDEVDAGIGGEVARSVGEHLHELSSRKQVFCITHLASIAVFADNHLQVDKRNENGRTVTGVQIVTDEKRVREVARMLAGDSKDTVSLDYAARLLADQSRMKNGKEAKA